MNDFVCQLSINDIELGVISDDFDISSFDVTTSIGTIEFTINKVNENYDCPIYFYTNPYFENEKTSNYRALIDSLVLLKEKYDFYVLNLFDDISFNSISHEERKLYMADLIHPTRAGYLKWLTLKFEQMLSETRI